MFQTYFNWSLSALVGAQPAKADSYLKANLAEIRRAARHLLSLINYKPNTLYRGIILQDELKNGLPSHPNFTYLSFSEDLEIARSFADPGPNGFGSVYYLGSHGYVISYLPQVEEVLFHHKLLKLLPYQEGFEQLGIVDNVTMYQQEVMILQPDKPFTMLTKL
jgi:hypothetical protein